MKKTLIIFLLIILYACKFDKSEYFFFDKYDSMDVGDGKETFIYKSKKKWNYDTIIVYSDIEKFGENSTYIIALQNPNKELMLKRIISSLEVLYKYNSENDSVVVSFPHTYTNVEINKRYKKELDSLVWITKDSIKAYQTRAEDIFQNEDFYQRIYKKGLNYYIIDKKEDSVFGPLTKKEYRNIKEKRGIKLEFKN